MTKKAARSRKPVAQPRSSKAGQPVEAQALPARVRRRQITAHGAFRKDTMIHQAEVPPRAAWAGKPRRKKAG